MNNIDIDDANEWSREAIRTDRPNPFNTRRTHSSELRRNPVILHPINEVKPMADLRSKRTGVGNYEITRMNFLTEQPVGRNAIDFEKQQLLDTQMQGIKVRLGDKTIKDLFSVQVPDDTDVDWLEIYHSRRRAGESVASINANPPFSRSQRMIIKNINHGQQNLDLQNKMALLLAEIRQNAVESRSDNATITAQLMALVGNIQDLDRMTASQLDSLALVLQRLNLPATFEVFFSGTPQTHIVSYEQFTQNSGPITLYLLNSITRPLTLNEPIFGISNNPISLSSAITRLQTPRINNERQYFINLDDKTVINRMQAEILVSNGIDNGFLENVDLAIKNALPITPPLTP